MKSQRTDFRLICYCGRPLDTLGKGDVGAVSPAWPRAGKHTGRHRYDVAAGTQARFRWRCRRCQATPVLTGGALQSAYRKVETEGRRDIVLGVDL